MSRLYTVNQWNRQKFLPREEDLYSFGGFLGSLGSSVKDAWGNIGSQASQSGDQAGSSMGGFGQSIIDMGLEIPGKMKIPGTKRGLYDAADPLYWAANGNESVVGNAVSDIGVGLFKSSAKSGNLMGMAAGGIVKGFGSLINASMGTKVDEEALRRTNEGTNYLKNYNSTATTTDEVTGPMAVQNAENAYGAGWFRKGWARRRNRKLRNERAYAQNWAYRALDNNINNIARNQIDMGLANYTAFGGPIDTYGMPFAYPQQDGMTATGYNMMSDYLTMKKAQADNKGSITPNYNGIFASGGKIHINPKNRGKFNATKKRTGKTTEELTHSKNPLTRKRAIFAQNARKWRHDYGGPLFAFGGDMETNGSDFPTGLMHLDVKESHEENPYGGVKIGEDRNGTPNLLEGGEVVWNDYVFSNRLYIDDTTKEKFHIGKKREMTYADLAKKLEKEISERANDPISESGFNAQMQTLQEEQERQKQEMEAERAREAFEALPPEEQVAIMDRANQEEQMAQQAMQEQAIAQQAAEQQGMVQQPTPEEASMMQQQVPQEQMAMVAPQEMAYGGNLYAPGGTLDLTGEDISLIRRMFGNNRFTDGFEQTAEFLQDPVDYLFGDNIEAAVDKLASMSQPQLEKFFSTSVGQRVAELVDATSSDSKAQEAGVQRWARATGRLQRPVQRAVVTAAKKALAQSKQVARGQMKTGGTGKVTASRQIRNAGYSNAGKAPATEVVNNAKVPLNNAYPNASIEVNPTVAGSDWATRMAGTLDMPTSTSIPWGKVGVVGGGTAGVAGAVAEGNYIYDNYVKDDTANNSAVDTTPSQSSKEEPSGYSKTKAWLKKNHPNIKDLDAMATFLNKIAQEQIDSGQAERFAYRDAYTRLMGGNDTLDSSNRGYSYTGKNSDARKHYQWLRDLGMSDWKAFEIAFPEVPKDADKYGKGNYDKNNAAREALRREFVSSDTDTNSAIASPTTVYKALDGNRYNTKAEAMNANKAYLRAQQAAQQANEQEFTMNESQLGEPTAVETTTAQVTPSNTVKVATPTAQVASVEPTQTVTPTPVAEPSGVTTTGGYTVNGVTYPTWEEAEAASRDYAATLTSNILNGTVGTQPDASVAPEVVEEEWAKENPMIAAPSNNVPTASWIPEWIPEDQKRDWTEVTTPTATAATAARVGRTKGTNTNGEDIPTPKDHWMRYAGLFGPAVGLGMMAAGVGKPDYSRLDAAVEGLGNPTFADWKPIGNYLTYRPMDIWYMQNRMDANARATDRAIANNAAPVGTKMAGLLANSYNNQLASGNLFRQALEYNDALRKQVEDFNRSTNLENSKMYANNSQFNAQAANQHNQMRARLGLAAAQQRLDSDAGWYNSLYGNVAGLFKGASDLGRDKTEKSWLEWLEKRGAFGNTGRNITACGGKIKTKKRRGFTY